MKNRYEQKIMTFMGWLVKQSKLHRDCGFEVMFDNIESVIDNPDADISFIQMPYNSLVSKKDNNLVDYSVYFSVMDLYNAIVFYSRYRAKYNLKDERLENAFNIWDKIVHTKITMKDLIQIIKYNIR
ncbi:MAG: hypothetical protein IKM94_05140 [Alphaproteobacteria bacterium]|nr:hypothetical protein [Alphaproteobacteria bacterium]